MRMRLDVLQVLPKARHFVLNLLLQSCWVVEAPHKLCAQEERRKRHIRGSELVAERELAHEQLFEHLRALEKACHYQCSTARISTRVPSPTS
jgi:hypothetical protein